MAEKNEEKPRAGKRSGSRALRWCAAIAAALALALYGAAFFLDEPLRGMMEKRMNRHLKGYSVKLPGLHLNPFSLSLTLKGLTVLQLAHPDPAVVRFPVLKASVLWSEVLSGKLVAVFTLDRPSVNINLQQLHSEATSNVKLKEQGWQQAVEEIYPLKINILKVSDASVTYVNRDPAKPLVLSHLNLQASNIRNLHLPDQVYPSSFHMDTAIFGTGRGVIDGAANFLGEPYPGLKGRVKLANVPLDHLQPLLTGPNLSFHGGVLGVSGEAEYAPKLKTAHLERLDIQGMNLDYIHSKRTAALERERAAAVEQAARKLSKQPGLSLRADRISLTRCTIGYVDDAAVKPYRVFLSDADFVLSNYSPWFSQGPAQASLRGKFMNSGNTTASATFRPAKVGRDFDLHVEIEETRMRALNPLLRSYGNFDVSAGVFSLAGELHVKNDNLSGYLKPFFKDIQVYDRRKDQGRSISHKMYELLVGGVAKVLKNRPSQEVATRVAIKGSLKNPQTSSWQIVAGLLKNAFFKALLPGFENVSGHAKP